MTLFAVRLQQLQDCKQDERSYLRRMEGFGTMAIKYGRWEVSEAEDAPAYWVTSSAVLEA